MTPSLFVWPLLGAAALLAALEPPTAPDSAAEAPTVTEAPASATQDEDGEALKPTPSPAERPVSSRGFVLVKNPAFPFERALEKAAKAPKPAVDRGMRYEEKDLSPYFAEGHLLEARTAFGKGQYARVRELLAEETSLPARYLRALAAVRGELHEPAAAEMAALADEYGPMRDRCLAHAAASFEQLRQFDRAAELYGQVRRGSRVWVDAQLGLFRTLKATNRLDEAADALKPLTELRAPGWGRNVPAEALLALAELERARKRPQAEREALWKVWAQNPLSPVSKRIEARLDLKNVPLERYVDRAEALIESHRNQAGITYLEPKLAELKLPDPLACRARFVMGKALRKERQHLRAIEVLEPVVEKCRDPDLRPRAMYVLASSRSIATAAYGSKVYAALAQDYPEHSFADDALFYGAELDLKNGDIPSALERLELIGQRYPEGDYAAEALFKSFWIRRAQGDREAALAVLDRIDALFADAFESYERERSRYWRARMHEGAGETKEAVQLLEQLAVDHPATYYGLIARKRLARLDQAASARVAEQLTFPPAGSVWPMHAGPLSTDPHFLTAVELYRLGFPEAVTTELLAANRTRAPPEAVRLVVVLLDKVGDQRAAHGVARTSLRGDITGRITAQNRAVWELAYPRAFRPMIEKHTKDAGIDPDLLQALMREESALDPKAMSWAGALGLTQLMPSTAKSVGRRLGIKNITHQRLLEPDLNIRIGSAYLGELMKQFDGTHEYAIAGYNAGGGASVKWRRERPTHEVDEWVEEIPISETRGYVKRVLRTYNTYQLLYRPPASPATRTAER